MKFNIILLNIFLLRFIHKIKCSPDNYLDIQLSFLILSAGNENGIAIDNNFKPLNIDICINNSGSDCNKSIIDIIPSLNEIYNNPNLKNEVAKINKVNEKYQELYKKAKIIFCSYANINESEFKNLDEEAIEESFNKNDLLKTLVPSIDLFGESELITLSRSDQSNIIKMIMENNLSSKVDKAITATSNVHQQLFNACINSKGCKDMIRNIRRSIENKENIPEKQFEIANNKLSVIFVKSNVSPKNGNNKETENQHYYSLLINDNVNNKFYYGVTMIETFLKDDQKFSYSYIKDEKIDGKSFNLFDITRKKAVIPPRDPGKNNYIESDGISLIYDCGLTLRQLYYKDDTSNDNYPNNLKLLLPSDEVDSKNCFSYKGDGNHNTLSNRIVGSKIASSSVIRDFNNISNDSNISENNLLCYYYNKNFERIESLGYKFINKRISNDIQHNYKIGIKELNVLKFTLKFINLMKLYPSTFHHGGSITDYKKSHPIGILENGDDNDNHRSDLDSSLNIDKNLVKLFNSENEKYNNSNNISQKNSNINKEWKLILNVDNKNNDISAKVRNSFYSLYKVYEIFKSTEGAKNFNYDETNWNELKKQLTKTNIKNINKKLKNEGIFNILKDYMSKYSTINNNISVEGSKFYIEQVKELIDIYNKLDVPKDNKDKLNNNYSNMVKLHNKKYNIDNQDNNNQDNINDDNDNEITDDDNDITDDSTPSFIEKVMNTCKRYFYGNKNKREESSHKCLSSHEKNSKEVHKEHEAVDIKEKIEYEKVEASEDSFSLLVNALKNIKTVSKDSKILPDDEYDENKPTFFYKNSDSMDDVFENIMDTFDELSGNSDILSSKSDMAKIINGLRYLKQYIDSEESQAFNNKEYNKEKMERINNLKSRYNMLHRRFSESDMSDDIKEKFNKSVKTANLVDLTNSKEKQAESEIAVISSIKNILGESGLTLETDGEFFKPFIDSSSISEGSTNYVEAIDKLSERLDKDENAYLLTLDTEILIKTANLLYSDILERNANSDDYAVTKALNKLYKKLYNIASKKNIKMESPLEHLNSIDGSDSNDITNDSTQQDYSNSKLSINKSEPDELCDEFFVFIDDEGNPTNYKYAKDNMDLISNTFMKQIEDNARNDLNKSMVNRYMISLLKSIKNAIKKIGNAFEKDLNEKHTMYKKKIEVASRLYELYKNVKDALSTNNYDISSLINEGIDDIINIYSSDGKMAQMLKTQETINAIKLLKFIKYITKDNKILPYDGKMDPSKNPSYEKLSNADNALTAKEIAAFEKATDISDYEQGVDMIRMVFNSVSNVMKSLENFSTKNILKKNLNKKLKKALSSSVDRIKTQEGLHKSSEEHAMISEMASNISENIDISETESYDDIVYDSIVGVLEAIKEETNDDSILSGDISVDENGLSVPSSLVEGANNLDDVLDFISSKLTTGETSKRLQKRINKNVKKLLKMVNKSVGGASKNDVNTATKMARSINSMLPDNNESKASNSNEISAIEKNNSKNGNKNIKDKLKYGVKKIKRKPKKKN